MKTRIDGGWVVGFDAARSQHMLIPNGVVIVEDSTILHVGTDYAEPVDFTIDARRKLVGPGFVNTHVHAGIEGTAGLQDLLRTPRAPWLGAAVDVVSAPLVDYLDDDALRTHMEFGLIHLLKSGCTTIVDVIGSSSPWWVGNTPRDVEAFVQAAGRLGARVYSTPGYRSLRACLSPDGTRTYASTIDGGFRDLERAIAFIQEQHGSYNGRIMGMLYPHAVDNVTPELLRATREAADDLGVGIQIHAAQSTQEVDVIEQRYGRSPIELLADTGVLGPDVILGHCIFLNSHSQVNRQGRDLDLIAEAGASVAHSPLKFVYSGAVIESFQRYLDRGVNLTIGTDQAPSDVLLEMRVASLAGKLVERSVSAVGTADLYNAATLGGAKALRRSDVGNLSAGARADMIIIDLENIDVGPVFDPIKALVHYCTARDVDTVIVDGRTVIRGHEAVGIDEERLFAEALPVYERIREQLVASNWNHPTPEEMFPFCLPVYSRVS